MSDNKRKADDNAGGDAKKPKVVYTLNVNNALDKAHESLSFGEIAKLPVGALEGIGEKMEEMLKSMKINTIAELANWKFFQASRAICVLADREEEGKRHEDSKANINHILDKEWETKSLKEIAQAPPSALSGLAEWADGALAVAHLTTIEKLSKWKFALWAEALVKLAEFENADFSSR